MYSPSFLADLILFSGGGSLTTALGETARYVFPESIETVSAYWSYLTILVLHFEA